MTDNDSSLDIVGLGKLAKSIPASSWNKLVTTACKTFTEFLAPITATTIGVGKLIEAKFDRLVEAEKILASETIRRAQEKIDSCSYKSHGNIKPQIILNIISVASTVTEDTLHELWSNLLAREVLDGNVHPEIPRILERMVSSDAHVISNIANGCEKLDVKYSIKRLKEVSPSFLMFNDSTSKDPLEHIEVIEKDYPFTYAHLENLGLIYSTGEKWDLSPIGREFMRSVSDPSIEAH